MQTQQPINPQTARKISRRGFLAAAGAVTTFMALPRHVLGGAGQTSPNNKLHIAGVGFGGQGASDLAEVSSQNIVALCDVDWDYAAKTFKQYPAAKPYKDFRQMLDKEKGIDASRISLGGKCDQGFIQDTLGARISPGASLAGGGLQLPVLVVCGFLLGAAGQMVKLCADSAMQIDVDDALRGHVFAEGAHQEIGDTYYQAITVAAGGALAASCSAASRAQRASHGLA